jgi:hypothetical protein
VVHLRLQDNKINHWAPAPWSDSGHDARRISSEEEDSENLGIRPFKRRCTSQALEKIDSIGAVQNIKASKRGFPRSEASYRHFLETPSHHDIPQKGSDSAVD